MRHSSNSSNSSSSSSSNSSKSALDLFAFADDLAIGTTSIDTVMAMLPLLDRFSEIAGPKWNAKKSKLLSTKKETNERALFNAAGWLELVVADTALPDKSQRVAEGSTVVGGDNSPKCFLGGLKHFRRSCRRSSSS